MTLRRNKLRKKSGSSSNQHGNGNGNHTADHDAKRSCGNVALFEYDKCHNAGAPCCNALRDIVTNMFPDAIPSNVEQETNAAGSGAVQEDNQTQLTQSASSDKSEKSIPSPSLFSLVVRKHLLEDRKKRLGGDLSRICHPTCNANDNPKVESASASGTTTTTKSTTTTASASKKKRKKKKKKSRSSLEQSQGQAQTSSPTPPISAQPPLQVGTKQATTDQNSPSPSPANVIHSTIEAKYSTNTNTNKDTKLDAMLDQLLIQANEKPQTNTNSITLPQNRDLISLVEYISNKCQRQPSSSQSSPTLQSHKSSKTKQSKRGCQSTNTRSSIEIPIIPLQEITEMIKKITCQDCQISCMKYLEYMSYDSSTPNHNHSPKSDFGLEGGDTHTHQHDSDGIPSELEVGWGGYQVEEQEKKGSNDSRFNGTRTRQEAREGEDDNDCMVLLSSIQLDGNSIAVKKDASRFSATIKRDEHAFDYDLMEEGGFSNDVDESDSNGAVSNLKVKDLKHARGAGSGSGSGLRMDLVQEKGTLLKYFRLNLGLDDDLTFTVDNFDSLIKDIIIPCGTKEVAIMTEEDIKQVTMNTEHLSEFLFGEVKCGLPQTLSDSQKALDDAEEYLKSPGAFNVKAVKSLRHCCELQVTYMERCKEFLTKLEGRTLQMQASKHEHQKWVCGLMNKLWSIYMDCSRSLVEPSLRCMWEGIQLDCKRTGCVPQYFNSPPQRENLKKLLEKRLLILAKLQDKIELELLSSPKNENGNGYSAVPVLRRLATFGEYFALKEANASSPLNQLLTEIDEMMALRNELICSTINQTDVNTILQIQSDRCTRLYNKINHVCKLVNDRLENMDMDQKDKFTWQANTIMIEENMMAYEESRTAEVEPSLERDLNDVLNLCEFVKNVLNQFRFYSVVEAKRAMHKSDENEQIPAQVLKICERAFASLKCEGDCGLRRVTGILSAYLYFWLQERCMEWHADLTHQELMIETEEELLQESKENAAKEQKKKAKKKKKRKGSPKKSSSHEHEARQLDESLDPTEVNENRQVSPTAIESFPMTLEGSMKESSTSQSETLVKNEPLEDSQSLSKIVKEDSLTDLSLDETKEEVPNNEDTLEDTYVEVCVTDKGEKISAEFFLCSRYFQVLEDRNIKY